MALRLRWGGLRGRLVLVTMLIAALVMAAVVVLVQLVLGRFSDSDSTHLARARADAAAGTVRLDHGRVRVLEAGTDSLDRDVWVFDAAGKLVEGNLPTGFGPTITALGARPAQGSTVAADRLRLVARPVAADGRRIAVVVAGVDLRPYEDGERRGLWLSLALALLTVLAAGLAARGAVGHTLGQVRHMVRSAQDWEEHDLDSRFAMGEPVDEITELGRTLDHMLDRIAAALHAERRLSDEMAHELRTPLTVIRAEAELALRRADPVQAESLRSIIEAAGRVDGVVGSMLDAARSRHDEAATADVAHLLIGLRRRVPPGVELRLPAPGEPVPVAAPPLLVEAAMGPLVDNAVRHARSLVELTLARRGDLVVVSVLDDGPGVRADELEAIFRPGVSGANGGASGLGLAVVQRLVDSVGGTVTARPGAHGCFEIALPTDDLPTDDLR